LETIKVDLIFLMHSVVYGLAHHAVRCYAVSRSYKCLVAV